jgi:hypothetical protein
MFEFFKRAAQKCDHKIKTNAGDFNYASAYEYYSYKYLVDAIRNEEIFWLYGKKYKVIRLHSEIEKEINDLKQKIAELVAVKSGKKGGKNV